MINKNLVIVGVVLALVVGGGAYIYSSQNVTAPTGGENSDLIRVFNVSSGQTIKSPFTVKGEARGTWYFEASFPVELLDANGASLFLGPAQAKSDWMTEDFVPFEVTLTFKTPATDTGMLVLKNDNPSGEPARDKFLRIPVKF